MSGWDSPPIWNQDASLQCFPVFLLLQNVSLSPTAVSVLATTTTTKKNPPKSLRILLPLNLSLRSGVTTSWRHVGTFPQECSVPSISRGSGFFSEPDTASVTPFPPALLEAPIPDLVTRAEPKLAELRGTQKQQWRDGLWTFTFSN